MSGWNILYGLINFVILAGGLFLVGRKIVRNMLEKHRDEVQKGLEDSEQAAENAGKLLQELPEKDARGRKTVARIAEEAEETARQRRAISAQAADKELAALTRDAAGEDERYLRSLRRDLNAQASKWWSSILTTGKPTEGISWNTDKLEELLFAQTVPAGQPVLRPEDVSRSVIRMVLPVRQELIGPGLKKVRSRIDIPNVLTFFLGVPWAALAASALLAGLIALLESRRLRVCLKYIGAALGAAVIVLAASAVLVLTAGIEPMIREASRALAILYQEVVSQTLIRALVLGAVMAAGCIACLILCWEKNETA